MAPFLSPESFAESAQEFARSALEAHHARRFRRLALDAGTCLEHLAKACLAKRSPALLTELRGEANFSSLLLLLGVSGGKPLRLLRTVGLRDALERVKVFVQSQVSDADLRTLVDVRDGTVHAAQSEELEERLVVAFARHADAFLADLGLDRDEFWGDQTNVVDALLAEAADKTLREIAVRVAGTRADFIRRYGDAPTQVIEAVRQAPAGSRLSREEELLVCPACESEGVACGDHEVDWEYERDERGRYRPMHGKVWFTALTFDCRVCGLSLEGEAEVAAAELPVRWLVPGADPEAYDPGFDEEQYFEALEEERRMRDDTDIRMRDEEEMRHRGLL